MRYRNQLVVILSALASSILLAHAPAALALNKHTLPLVMPAGIDREGLIRVTNHSDRAGTVSILAIDDTGRRFGPVTLPVGAKATAQFFSGNLESGGRGLSAGVGDGTGYWRLELESDLDIEPLSYIRTPDKFLIGVHDVVQGRSMRWQVPFFNSKDAPNKTSWLRLVNTSGVETEVVIEGRDDAGAPAPGGDVRLTLPGDAARTLTAQMLELGDPTLDGSLGDGLAKWNLTVSAKRPIVVMGLVSLDHTGHLANLSTVTGDGVIRGGPGGDELWGGNGDDVIDPGDNGTSNNLDVDSGSDIVNGSKGNDRIVYTSSGKEAFQAIRYSNADSGANYLDAGISATIDGAANTATVDKGAAGTDTIVDVATPLDASGFALLGTGFDDVFDLTVADGQFMNISGGAGNDRFNVRLLDDGWVRVDYEYAPAGINVDLASGRARNDGHGSVDTFTGDIPKGIAGSEFSDVIRGSDRNEWFFGRRGNDDIDAGGGSDMLQFGYSSRFAAYTAGVQNLAIDLDAGTATGTWDGSAFSYRISNFERVQGTAGDDRIRGRIEELRASAGNDTITWTAGSPYTTITYAYLPAGSGITATFNGPADTATVDKGSAGTDTMAGIAEPMRAQSSGGIGLYGTSSDDVLEVKLNDDQWMQVGGGAGNDRINIRANYARIDWSRGAKNGIDLDLRAGLARDDGFGDTDTITGTVWEVRGTDFKDVMRGSDDGESFIGRGGDDVIDGRGGFDRVNFARDCCATITALEVNLGAGYASGTWNGRAFRYTLSSIEYVRGTHRDDSFIGSAADERFRGNRGEDFFVFSGAFGHDRIEDFTNGDDVIVLLDLNITKQQVLDNASAWTDGTGVHIGVHIDLTGFGGGRIDLHGFRLNDLDASDFLL